MFYLLIAAALLFFIVHVALLFTAFPKSQLNGTRYLYSHITLWITGIVVFLLAFLYSGKGESGFLDYFNSPVKKSYILIFTIVLSLTAHTIVRTLIIPMMRKK